MEYRLDELIAPAFYSVHNAIDDYSHIWLCGGRGSTKSSFVSIEIILGIMKNPDTNAVVLRKVAACLRDSVFAQLEWAIEKLGVTELWDVKPSVPEMVFRSTGQRILFRGADKTQKLKSTKVNKGYIRYLWYEELDEFSGMSEIRSINQSMMRGGEKFTVFYSYNPPISQRSWVNRVSRGEREDMLVHRSTYMDVPREWLGEQFFLEAEYLKKTHPNQYKHEYLGEPAQAGGAVFDNVELRSLSDEEISGFDNIRCGVDFGFAVDPFVYVVCHFHNNVLYIFDEIFAAGLSNSAAAEQIIQKGYTQNRIICDSAEPKSIYDLRGFGLRAVSAKKGPGSIERGMKFLQSLEKIVIDSERCANAAREFSEYEYDRTSDGLLKACYPDRDNHTIDAVRYALEDDINGKQARIIKRSELNL